MDYEKAYKAVLQTATQWIKDGCTDKEKICLECVFPELRESEDERIRMALVEYFAPPVPFTKVRGIPIQKVRDWFEKQKEQKPVDDKSFEEWVDDWWKHHKVNNPDSYDKGDEIQFDERGFKNFCRGIKNMYAEQKRRDRFEEARKKYQVEWSGEDENALENLHELITFGFTEKFFDAQTTVDIRKWLNTRLKSVCPVRQEWSEEDELTIADLINYFEGDSLECSAEEMVQRIKSLHPSWKPSEEQMKVLYGILVGCRGTWGKDTVTTMESLYQDLKKLM